MQTDSNVSFQFAFTVKLDVDDVRALNAIMSNSNYQEREMSPGILRFIDSLGNIMKLQGSELRRGT